MKTSTTTPPLLVQRISPLTRRVWLDPTGRFVRRADPSIAASDASKRESAVPQIEHCPSVEDLPAHVLQDLRMDVDANGRVTISAALEAGEHIYGAVDADARSLNRRGEHVHVLTEMHRQGECNLGRPPCPLCDTASHHPSAADRESVATSMYSEIAAPWFISNRGYAVHISNLTAFGVLDLDSADSGRWSFTAPGGAADVHIIGPCDMRTCLRELATLTGHQPLPPAWTLGFIQSRFGYESFEHALSVLDRFERERLPVHGLVFDVQWLDQMVNLHWNDRRFADPDMHLAKIASHATGPRIVVITEPGTRTDADNAAAGVEMSAFALDADGDMYDSRQWYAAQGIPGYDEPNPVPGALLNVFDERACDWWYAQHLSLIEQGVDAWWLDLNEPEGPGIDMVFPTVDWPPIVDERGDPVPGVERPATGTELRNAFALAQQRAFTRRDLLHTGRRPFLLSRAAAIGSQRYGAAPWSGDVGATWSDLRHQPLLGLLAGMSGLPMWGCDVGGFHGHPDPELFVRWMQMGAFVPTFRAHGMLDDREPWSQGDEALEAIRPTLTLRAQLLPSIVTWARAAFADGQPLMSPMCLACPDDDRFASTSDQWLFGPLLVATVLRRGATEREVVLPGGEWIDLWSGASVEGGKTITVPVSLGTTPVYVPSGTLLVADPEPLARRARNWPPKELEAWTFGRSASGDVYVDDGNTRAHERGEYGLFELCSDGCDVDVRRMEGTWDPPRLRIAEPHPGLL